jgi:hypothetical protein
MKSSVTKTFRKRLSDLPASVQEQATKAYALWQEDPYHSSLQFKRVSQRQAICSARVSLNYRVLGLLESDYIYWFGLGHMMSMMSCLNGCSLGRSVRMRHNNAVERTVSRSWCIAEVICRRSL